MPAYVPLRSCTKRERVPRGTLPPPATPPVLARYPMLLYTLCFILLIFLILTHATQAAAYAAEGFLLWYSRMIPSLLPFMILSGLMIRMGLSQKMGKWFQPVLKPLLRCRPEVNYGILIGFLCGFPMGARVAAQLYQGGKIDRQEARFLLAFCNNIGPVYFCSFVLPLLGRKLVLPYVLGMYGIPLFYGVLLRRTLFRELPLPGSLRQTVRPGTHFPGIKSSADLSEYVRSISRHGLSSQSDAAHPAYQTAVEQSGASDGSVRSGMLTHLDDAVQSGLQSILSLCGYMVLFNLLNLIPHLFLPETDSLFAPLLEITGGLHRLGQSHPLYSLLLLPFGGLSCIAQTYSMIHETDLPLGEYVVHKLALTALTCLYYLAWKCLFPHLFLL